MKPWSFKWSLGGRYRDPILKDSILKDCKAEVFLPTGVDSEPKMTTQNDDFIDRGRAKGEIYTSE